MRLRARRPPGISAYFTFGMRGDRRGAAVGGGSSGMGRRGALRVMAGTLPGVLLRVNRTCVRGVVLRRRLLVGLGAAIIGGASVIRRNIGTLCSVCVIGTLCSGRVSGTGRGASCGSSAGRSHSWSGCVTWDSEWGVSCCATSFALSKVSTCCCFLGVNVLRVLTTSVVKPCRCSLVVRQGT